MKIESPSINEINKFADWIELYSIYKSKKISKSYLSRLSRQNGEEITDTIRDSIFSELDLRSKYYGNHSPYDVENEVIIPRKDWKNIPEYIMCLIFSLQGVIRGKDDGTQLFEKISEIAIRSYLGGDSILLGWPNRQNLYKNIEYIANKTNEKRGHHNPKHTDKDKGVDLIAWKPHSDKRSNQIVLLLQCGAGSNWDTKLPIDLRTWKDFFHWSAEPIQGIVTPIIVDTGNWYEIQNRYNLIFDRIRILISFQKSLSNNEALCKLLIKWCRKKLC